MQLHAWLNAQAGLHLMGMDKGCDQRFGVWLPILCTSQTAVLLRHATIAKFKNIFSDVGAAGRVECARWRNARFKVGYRHWRASEMGCMI